ncbi:MAG: LptF/LptG family permease [Solitalea-like symbiont of Tyrophagus putrescentiae]
MKKLDKYILITYLKPLFTTIIVVLFIFTLWFLYRYIDELVGKGLSASVIGELLLYNASSSVPLALPIAILFASLISFGNLTEFSELTAIKASGISLLKALKSAILLMVLVCIIAFYFANSIAPKSVLKMGALIYDLRGKKDAFELRKGIFYNNIDNYSILFNDKDQKTNQLKDIIIYKGASNNLYMIRSDNGIIESSPNNDKLLLKLYNGSIYSDKITYDKKNNNNIYKFDLSNFTEHMQVIPLSGFGLNRTPIDYFKNAYQIMNSNQLLENIKITKKTINNEIDIKIKDIFPDKRLVDRTYNNYKINYVTTHKHIDFVDTLEHLFRKNADLINNLAISYTQSKIVTPVYSINFPINIDLLNNIYDKILSDISRDIYALESLNQHIEDARFTIRQYEVELYKKQTLAVSCIILFFIGAPLAFIIHKGGIGIPLIISILFFLLFYALNIASEKLSKSGVLEPIVGMWLPVFILSIIASILLYISMTETKPSYLIGNLIHSVQTLYKKKSNII